jgi:general secretion pathway protein A
MDYLDFFGLGQEPFSMAPVSRFYFNSAQHSRALVRLMYAVDTMKGLAVLIGDIGTGKTTLARRMLDSLPEEEYESALLVIIHSGITADWLLERIALQLGVKEPEKEKLKLLNQLYRRLTELQTLGKKAVVLIDEAQMLKSREIMEEFRGVLNLEMSERKLITFVFFGLPEIDENLKLDKPLEQRVALKYTLEPFNEESTRGYIQHRMRLAGAHEEIFDSKAIFLVHHYARGIPRLINTICDNSLFEGYLLRQKRIDSNLITNVVRDLGLIDEAEEAPEIPESVIGTATRESQLASSQPRAQHQPQRPGKPPAQKTQPGGTRVSDNEVNDVLNEFDNLIANEHKTPPAPQKQQPKKEVPARQESNENDIDSMLDDLEEK